LLGRFSLILVAQLEPMYLHRGSKPEIPVNTYFQLWMLVQHIIGCGKDAYLAANAEPRSVAKYIPEMTSQTGLYALALFRLDELTFEAQKLRLISAFVHPHDPAKKQLMAEKFKNRDLADLPKPDQFFVRVVQRVSGFYNVVSDLRDQFAGPAFDHGYPELYPTFEELPDGNVVLKHYAPRPTDRPLANDLKDLPPTVQGDPKQSKHESRGSASTQSTAARS